MADESTPIESVFNESFAQQVAFFRQKLGNLVPTRRWDDIWQEAHDNAFMVAGAAKADLLADLAGSVDQAISQGQTLDGFRKDFRTIIERHGWAGFTGDDRTAERPKGSKGLAWRTRIIYETNLITSYSAGRLAQLKEAGYTWWIYRHSDFVRRPRPAHVALDGITRAADDPFWRTYYPPNGWGCRCRVVGARGPASIERLGGSKDKPMPAWVGQTNPKTGAPVGIDRGFAYQPGGTSGLVREIERKITLLPPKLATDLAHDVGLDVQQPQTIDDYIALGRRISESIPAPKIDDYLAIKRSVAAMQKRLERDVGISTPMKAIRGLKSEKALVIEASKRFPDRWTKAADEAGTLFVRKASDNRGWHWTVPEDYRGRSASLPGWEAKWSEKDGRAGFMTVRPDSLPNTVHELAHRLQSTLPGLDALYQQLHRRRTAGEALQSLRDLEPKLAYNEHEMSRPDGYVNPYQGREYGEGQALEVLTMAMEYVVGVDPAFSTSLDKFAKMYYKDREMFDLTIGLLFHWRP